VIDRCISILYQWLKFTLNPQSEISNILKNLKAHERIWIELKKLYGYILCLYDGWLKRIKSTSHKLKVQPINDSRTSSCNLKFIYIILCTKCHIQFLWSLTLKVLIPLIIEHDVQTYPFGRWGVTRFWVGC
jgi:hypothetical protein